MDTRREHGQYWPGTRTGSGEAPTPADNGKVDRVDLGTLAPDATASEMRTAIRNIQNAMRPLATALAAALCGFVMAQTAPWDGLRGGVHVVTNEEDAVAMAEIARATNGIPAEIAAATNDIPAQIAAATNGIPTEIAAATNGLPERIDAVTNGLSAYALKTQIPDMPDLSPYALKSEVPPAPDLTGYATKYEVALATNGVPARIAAATNGLPEKIVAATNGIPARIAASTNGMPEKIAFATNALNTSLAPTISAATTALQPAATNGIREALAVQSESLETHSREIARLSQQIAASQTSNTAYRLMSPDGDIYQDATGTVWRAEVVEAPGLFRLKKIEYYTNSVYQTETNAPTGIFWSMYEGYGNAIWEIGAGGSGEEEDPEGSYWNWLEVTNQVAAADMGDSSKFYYVVELDVAGEDIVLETNGWIYATSVLIEWPMSNTNVERYLVFERTNVTATIRTPIDRVMYASEKEKFISTNDVKAIVTNEVELGYRWIWVGGGDWGQPYYENGRWHCDTMNGEEGEETDINAASLTFFRWEEEDEQDHFYTANRIQISRNALGLARLSDLPALTNGIPEAIGSKASKNEVCNIVTNEVVEFSAWKWDAAGTSAGLGQPEYGVVLGDGWTVNYEGMPWQATETSETATELHFDFGTDFELHEAVATLTLITRNTLGLARLVDLPPLTNGLATAASVAAADTRATDAQTMAAAASNYTARVDAELSAISNKAPAVADTILGVRWVLKATNGVIYAEVEQQ